MYRLVRNTHALATHYRASEKWGEIMLLNAEAGLSKGLGVRGEHAVGLL